ncbi:flagellar FliJ protein [Novimethylophilus kurashikiensis]|uniref:Flagellar FliJ protein n=1 Tax=Novimethylophilus kurashikiensis TaxID=1825523 RepID=A0A2R5F286_9PROT|nr:flagellar export protein FliJ [Novimethylophilus kurashikiensis]GBG12565.1 flagellar FliJ protein [Novimethylophilus kurashikiensis]
MATFRLAPLVKFAEERSEAAAQELQRHRIQLNQAEEKLKQLQGFLADYQARLGHTAGQGVTVQTLIDFQQFIGKLEIAIRSQSEEVVRCRQRWENAQEIWMERERELKAYLALRDRHDREEIRKDNRRDQRLQDEFAQNALRRRAAEENSQD